MKSLEEALRYERQVNEALLSERELRKTLLHYPPSLSRLLLKSVTHLIPLRVNNVKTLLLLSMPQLMILSLITRSLSLLPSQQLQVRTDLQSPSENSISYLLSQYPTLSATQSP